MTELNRAIAKDGCEIAYELLGTPGAPRLALIHSLALDRSIWERVAARLQEDFHILAYDCRGHGASEKAAGPYEVLQFADDLESVMQGAGFETALVFGCSMGGCIAQAFASAHPDRTEGLGLVDTTAWYGEAAPAQWRERAAKARRDGLSTFTAHQTVRWFSDAFQAAERPLLDRLNSIFLANDLGAYEATCLMLGDADLRGRLTSFSKPTTIIVGEEDFATPIAMSQDLHRAIAGSTLRVLPKARHLTPLERPDEISAAIRELAARVRLNHPT